DREGRAGDGADEPPPGLREVPPGQRDDPARQPPPSPPVARPAGCAHRTHHPSLILGLSPPPDHGQRNSSAGSARLSFRALSAAAAWLVITVTISAVRRFAPVSAIGILARRSVTR